MQVDIFKKSILAIVFIGIMSLSLGVGIYSKSTQLKDSGRPGPEKNVAKREASSRVAAREAIAEASPDAPVHSYDVLIYGGTPEAVAAAISCSRRGLKVCLVNDTETLGGVWASGELNQMDNTYKKITNPDTTTTQYTLTAQGINESLMKVLGIKRLGNGFYDGVFDSYKVSPTFKKLLAEHKVDRFVFSSFNPIVEPRRISMVEFKIGKALKRIKAQFFVDASENGDLAARAGCPYTLGRGQVIYGTLDRPVALNIKDYGPDEKQMSATLMFRLGGVRWEDLSNIVHNGEIDKFARSENAGWGYNVLAPEFNDATSTANGIMLRGLNLGRQSDGTVLVNGILIFNVNGTLWASVEDGKRRARAELPRIVSYLKANIPPFRDAFLVDSAETLYIRESRHFIGEYILTLDDLLTGAQPYDTIALANHAVDEHPYTVEDAQKNLQTYGSLVDAHLHPMLYGIPLRSLLPMSIDNLAVVGRTISCTPKAAASARVISIGISEAQAIGGIIKIAKDKDTSLKALALDQNFWQNHVSEMP